MRYIATTKVAGGKLLRVKADVDGGAVTRAELTGDFFLHPEDGVDALERVLIGVDVGAAVEAIEERLHDAAMRDGLTLVGFEVRDVAQTLYIALHSDSVTSS